MSHSSAARKNLGLVVSGKSTTHAAVGDAIQHAQEKTAFNPTATWRTVSFATDGGSGGRRR